VKQQKKQIKNLTTEKTEKKPEDKRNDPSNKKENISFEQWKMDIVYGREKKRHKGETEGESMAQRSMEGTSEQRNPD